MLSTILFFIFNNRVVRKKQLIIFPLLLLFGCQSGLVDKTVNSSATEGYSAEQTDKLFVVDCLLPGQIHRLGNQMEMLTARRPIKTTAGDCETRGGQYVAYDRANYATALEVWIPQAKNGNPKAQVILGEIYEKGLGGLTDPVLAAKWYRKAAEQGSSRGQINLGHLYEKGLGVEQNLPEALNWYRKASGLEDTDLEYASVTEAVVSAGYEKQLDDLRQQLNLTRQSYEVQQDELKTIKNQLDKTRQMLRKEKNKKVADQQLIKRLEKDLQTKQASFDNQKTKLSKSQIAMHKENQDSVSKYGLLLENKQHELALKENRYHQVSNRITITMQQIDKKSSVAASTQDNLAIEHLRASLNLAKVDLQTMGQEIKQLKSSIADNQNIIASLGNISIASVGIEIIEPHMFLTRGIPSYQLRSFNRSKEIIGKVLEVKELQLLTVNGQTIHVNNQGIFQTQIGIDVDINPVEIIATYQQGSPKKLNFNILAKGTDSDVRDQDPPPMTISSSYPSINFGRFYALVIGNQDYARLPALKTSVNDARAVEEILRTRYGYQTTLLINASRHQVMTAFNDLREVLSEKDNLLIYYAGHGEIDKSDQSAYWLPTDAEMNNSANWLSSHSITQFLNIIDAKHILVVADSCYSGAMTQTAIARLPEQMAEEKRKKWLKFMVKRKARTVMTSGGVKPVLDSGGGQHSVFAKAFLNVLKRNNGLMEDYELFRAVSGYVKKSASLVGFQQLPQYSAMLHAGHEGSPFFFVPTKP
ncbi:MAG: caspase family protein [Methylococcales bacterium]